MMDRNAGTGPFAADKPEPLFDVNGEAVMGVRVNDQTGAAFAYVHQDDCHGMDGPAARARAQHIAEALNRNDSLKAVLVKAREIIQTERDTTVECATLPPHTDLTTLDDQTRPFVEAFDQVLAEIDEALR